MKIVHDVPKRAYINVMELLVAEEVENQIKGLPPRVLKYLKGVEVETYALNRLPALYASSEKGWQHQYEKAKRELRNQIKSAVRQALAAVQVDPLRTSKPLELSEDALASGALKSLRDLFKQPDLDWEGVIKRLRVMIPRASGVQASGAQASGAQEPSGLPPSEASHRTRYRQNPPERSRVSDSSGAATPSSSEGGHSPHWRPGTYGSEVSWQRTHSQGNKPSEFDWNDSRYSK